jgi:DNA-binding GntR family transcriptional regulator
MARSRLQYRKLSEEIADVLQQMIARGELKSGQRVTQEELAEMLGVSTMPIREALLKLVANGLVEVFPNRSFRIVTTTVDDMRDEYWMHAVLEGELTRRACSYKGAQLAPVLRHLEEEYSRAAAAVDGNRLEEANTAFHRAINRAAEAPKLIFMLKTTLRIIPDGWYPQIPEWVPVSEAAHEKIILGFENEDPDAAGRAAADHVVEAGELVIASFAATSRWSQGPAPAPAPAPVVGKAQVSAPTLEPTLTKAPEGKVRSAPRKKKKQVQP